MAWIIAAAAVGSALLNANAQNQSAGTSARQGALQQGGAGQPQPFTPTAQAAQGQSSTGEQSGNPFFDAPFNSTDPPAPSMPATTPAPQPGSQSSGQGGTDAATQGAQIGQALGDLLQKQQGVSQAGEASRAQLLASRPPPQAAAPFQSTASQFSSSFGSDPRLQQLLMGL